MSLYGEVLLKTRVKGNRHTYTRTSLSSRLPVTLTLRSPVRTPNPVRTPKTGTLTDTWNFYGYFGIYSFETYCKNSLGRDSSLYTSGPRRFIW